ncbi:MAG: PEP/pyruvate-binding domain-containing protein, partial [Oscillospiraceae bacterium]
FFRVTCPYLFELDTVAYFPLLRGRHSFDAVARIRDTTQLLLDVYSEGDTLFLHPLKVWNRYSDRMFLPYCYQKEQNDFTAVEDAVGMSRYYQIMQDLTAGAQDQNYDSHDRFFSLARLDFARGTFSADTEEQIIDSTMTKDVRLKDMVKRYFTPADYFQLRDRMIGSGAIGGKACGMLLARKIAQKEIPEFSRYSEPHDSFYIGSDVFYTYIVSNGCWRQRIRQRTPEGYFTEAEDLKKALLEGTFPSNIREQFQKVLDYFGQSPFIVRSSSFLEDGFGNAFAGKYESVFCVNQGDPQERLNAFEQAVRVVYASTMNRSALEYRLQRGMSQKDEQMAVLVQRVSGSYFGHWFLPGAAGVGYSHSTYQWNRDMDPDAGMLRLVVGLGTRAVDRPGEDYPRLANLDRPTVTVATTVADKHRFSQRYVDVLDCQENRLRELPLDQLLPSLPVWYRRSVMERDREAEAVLRDRGAFREIWFANCQALLENKTFTGLMQQILKTLERVYGNPVDIEYTVNMDETGAFVVNLLQCRPLYQGRTGEQVDLNGLHLSETLFDLRDSSMGSSGHRAIDAVVWVDPKGYRAYPYSKKAGLAAAVGKVNHHYSGSGKRLLLLAPGRLGTSSPELGIPLSFGDITNFTVVCEVSDRQAGFMPELSYGSHMFQDLVEAEIAYGAVWGNEKTAVYRPELLDRWEDLFPTLCPEYPELNGMVKVVETPGLGYWLDAVENRAVCGLA